MTTTAKPRKTAGDRREAILDAAIDEIAAVGFRGATTAAIAARAGISQPYVFRFFPTKKDLVLAVVDRAFGRVLADWETAVPQPGETRLATLGRTYVERIAQRRSELLVHLQAYAGADDPDVAEAVRHHLGRVYRYVVHALRRDGEEAPERDAATFIGRGFLITASMACGLESVLTSGEWQGICSCPQVARIEDRDPPAAA